MRVLAKFVLHAEVFVRELGKQLLNSLFLAHLNCEVEWRVVINIPRELVGFLGKQ